MDSELTAEVRDRVEALGYELVDLRLRGAGRRVSLQIRIDRPEAAPGHGITVEECGTVSRALSAWLDEAQVLAPRYALEVSSPGLDRPIRWREHWERFTGSDVKVRLEGLGRIRATILRVVADAEAVVLKLQGGEEVTVPLDQARDATLVVDWSAIGRSLSRRGRTNA